MAEEDRLFQSIDGVGVLTLHRPWRSNALSLRRMAGVLREHIGAFLEKREPPRRER